MTAELTTKLTNLPTNDQLGQTISGINSSIATKLDKISDLQTIREGATAGATAVQPVALNNYYTKGQVDTKLSELDIPVVTATGGNGILVKDKHNISNGGHSVALGSWGDSSGGYSLTTGFATQATRIGSTATGFLTTTNGKGSFSGGDGDGLLNVTRLGEKSYQSDDILVSDLGRYIIRDSNRNNIAKVTSVVNKTFTTDIELSEDAEFTAHVCRTVADGDGSFAFGKHVVTVSDNQVALGKYNRSDASSLLMVGNGSSDTNRSNALEVTKSGNLFLQGDLSIKNHSDVGSEIGFAQAEITEMKKKIPTAASSSNQLADKEYVDTKVGSVGSAIETVDHTVGELDDTLAQHISNTNVHLSETLKSDIAKIGDIDSDLNTVKGQISTILGEISSDASSENKLIDKAYVDGELANKQDTLTFDPTPTQGSEFPVKSGGIWSEINRVEQNVSHLGQDIDQIMDAIPSGAGKYNKLVTKSELDTKQNTLTFDTIPTDGSTNPVESNGVFDAIKVVKDDIDDIKDVIPSEASSTNKLVDQEYVDDALESIDLSDYYTKGQVDTKLSGKLNSLTFDATPTLNSSNPVTSNGIKLAIDNATPNLQYDDLPTENSEKLVKSGRIYVALGERLKLEYETDDPVSTSGDKIVTSAVAYHYINPIKSDVADLRGGVNAIGSYIPSGTNNTDNKLVNQNSLSNYQTKLTFDENPTANSINPVRSRGIYTALSGKQDALTFDNKPTLNSSNPVKSGGVYSDIEAIRVKIPTQASSSNQLADKNYVDTNIATASATFRGTYHEKDDLGLSNDATHKQIADALKTVATPADLNDYCFVQIPEHATSPNIIRVERYKYANGAWAYEYDLNNSGFTGAQWAAINSGVTEINYAKHDHTHKVKINNIIKEITKTGSEDVVNLGHYLTAVPLATITALGGFKIGYLQNDKNYAVKLDENDRAYVNVPWTDTNTTYEVFSSTLAGLVPAASDTNKLDAETAVGNHYLCADGKFRKLPANAFLNTTYSFVDANATLAWGTQSKVATVGGVDIHVTMPANPNTWRPLGTGATDACAGNDARLSNSRPASDVYAWAKASTKPTYTLDEVADGSTRKLSNYLPLSGGTISNASFGKFIIERSGSANMAAIGFKNSLGTLGYFAVNTVNGSFVRYKADASAFYTILDSANSSVSLSGSTLTVKINGTEKSLANTWRGIQDNLTSSTNTTESLSAKQGYLLANGSARDNTKLPLSGGTMSNTNVVTNLNADLLDGQDGTYYATTSDVSTLQGYFTSGAANKAVKLNTPRTIWGQSFDGSANITGRMYSVDGIGNWMNFNNSYGSVGVGGAAPTDYYVLKFHRNVNRPCMIFNDTRTTAGFQKIEFLRNGTDMGGIHWFHDKYSNYNFLQNCINFDAKEGCVTFGTWDDPTFFIDEAVHSVGVDMSSPQHKVDVNGDIHASDGIISDTYVTALATSTTSDKRLKDVKEDVELSVDTIAEAPSVKFEWKNNKELGEQVGTIAQYWEEKLPQVVHKNDKGDLSLQYDVTALLSSISLAKKVKEQDERIKALEEQNKILLEEIKQIKEKLL